jgi:hypothetical protein
MVSPLQRDAVAVFEMIKELMMITSLKFSIHQSKPPRQTVPAIAGSSLTKRE